MALALAGPMIGCGDDSSPSGDGNGSSGDTGPLTTGSDTTDGADDGTTTAVATSDADSGDETSTGEPPPVDVTVEGEVVDFVLEAPIPNAQITVYGDASISTTADNDGLFSIGPFQPNTNAVFVLDPAPKEYWGAIIPIDIGNEPLQEDVELTQISTTIVDAQIMGLEAQGDIDPQLDQAIVIVRLLNNTAVMEGPTTIEMDPPPADNTYYAPDPDGVPILNQNTIEWSVIPVVVYFNIPDSDPGEITFTATHPTRDCTVLYPELPTLGEHMTLVDVECLPPQDTAQGRTVVAR